MPEPDAPAVDPNNEPAAPADDGLPANDPNGEGTTPEEVAAVLKSSGIDLPENKPAAADDEEGEDPDKPADEEPAAPAADDEEEPAGDEEEPAADEVEPPAAPAAADITADEDKYSITVEDANGVSFKIPVGAKMEDILAEFEPKNNGQILDILDQLRDLKDEKAKDDAKAAKDTAIAERTERAAEFLKGWGEEATALQGAKRIPDGEPGEKRISEVYKFMADENDARMKAGKPTLNSFEDALDKLENKEARDKTVADAKAEKEDARKKGSLVGGASAPASSGTPVYKAGTARNANQALRSMGMI